MRRELREVPDKIQKFIREAHGDMAATGIDEAGTLYIETYGECSSCPYSCLSSESELSRDVVEKFPEISRVSVTPAISEETISLAKKILGISDSAAF